MEGFGDDDRRMMREQLELVERNLGTAASGIDQGASDEYLREALFALHDALAGVTSVVRQLVDDSMPP